MPSSAKATAAKSAARKAFRGDLAGSSSEGLDEPQTEGLDEPKKEGLDEPKKQGLDEAKKQGLDEAKKPGLDEAKKPGLDEAKKPLKRHVFNSPTADEHDLYVDAEDEDALVAKRRAALEAQISSMKLMPYSQFLCNCTSQDSHSKQMSQTQPNSGWRRSTRSKRCRGRPEDHKVPCTSYGNRCSMQKVLWKVVLIEVRSAAAMLF